MADWREYEKFLHELTDASGAVIRPHFREKLDVGNKTDRPHEYDPVTVADRDAESAIRSLIEERYPGHAIFGEEHGRQGDGPETWVIDPIDGTRSFIGGFPTWGTLIAFNDGHAPIVGVMDQPITRERWIGDPEGSRLWDRPIQSRACPRLADATLYSTTPDMLDATQTALFEVVDAQVRLRRWGGDCYSYAMLAMGFVDVIIEAQLKPYDIQALVPIVRGAGGVITSWTGGSPDNGGAVVACGDPRLHEVVLKLLGGG